MKLMSGIEPTALAWEARVLPLYDARTVAILRVLPTLLNNSLRQWGEYYGNCCLRMSAALDDGLTT